MASSDPPPGAARPAAEAPRVPTLAQAVRELRVHGTGTIAEWWALLGPLAAQIRARDRALAARRRWARFATRAVVGSAVVGVVSLISGVFMITGIAAAALVLSGVVVFASRPPGSYVGTERIGFLVGIIDAFAAIAPDSRVRLDAQLDAAQAIPAVKLPFGFSNAEERGEREDAWLRGSLQGIPGMRVSWQATEWCAVSLRRRKNPRGKVKKRAKLAYASRLAARIDADHALFAMVDAAVPPGWEENVVDARKTRRGYTIRGWYERSAKLALASPDVRDGFAALREGGESGVFGARASALVNLLTHCEARLERRGARKVS